MPGGDRPSDRNVGLYAAAGTRLRWSRRMDAANGVVTMRFVSPVLTGVALGRASSWHPLPSAGSGIAVIAALVAATATYFEGPSVAPELVSLPNRNSPWLALAAGAVAVGVSVIGLNATSTARQHVPPHRSARTT